MQHNNKNNCKYEYMLHKQDTHAIRQYISGKNGNYSTTNTSV
jgi:hypothetical protein